MKKLVFLLSIYFLTSSCEEIEKLEIQNIYKEIPVSISYKTASATPDECPYGGYKTEVYIDGKLNTILPAVCNGEKGDKGDAGPQGNPGNDGKDGTDFDISELVFETTLIKIDELCRERSVFVNGEKLYSDTVCKGQKGDQGDAAEMYIPNYSTELVQIDSLCKLRKFYIDGEFFYQDTICNGEQGPQGPAGPKGEPGEDGKMIFRLTPFVDSCNTGDSHTAEEEGYKILNTPWSRNSHDAPNKNGTLVYGDYSYIEGTFWFPEFSEPCAIDSIYMDLGSRNVWVIYILLLHSNGEITSTIVIYLAPNPNLVWWDDLTYYQSVNYSLTPDQIKFKDIVRVGIKAVRSDIFEIPFDADDWRNYTLNIDNIYIGRLKIFN